MRLQRLTAAGIEAFAVYLDQMETDPSIPIPVDLLKDPVCTEAVVPQIEVEIHRFGSRFKAAEYLHECFSRGELTDIERDKGLWAWLALLYFNELCPPDSNGNRKVRERARYIPESVNFQRYYRHLLAGPYRIYRAHRDEPERAWVVLCQPLHKPGDIVEQLASRQELVTNRVIMEIASILYIDPATKLPKRGAQTKSIGAARRLADVLNQFDVTWDLYSMSANELMNILPTEFNRFRDME